MSDITKQSLSELIKNIKEKKLSSTEATKAFIENAICGEVRAWLTKRWHDGMNDEWWMMNDKWWMMNDEAWCMMHDAWWTMSDYAWDLIFSKM